MSINRLILLFWWNSRLILIKQRGKKLFWQNKKNCFKWITVSYNILIFFELSFLNPRPLVPSSRLGKSEVTWFAMLLSCFYNVSSAWIALMRFYLSCGPIEICYLFSCHRKSGFQFVRVIKMCSRICKILFSYRIRIALSSIKRKILGMYGNKKLKYWTGIDLPTSVETW